MKKTRILTGLLLLLLVLLALPACGSSEGETPPEETAPADADKTYTNGGLHLTVPAEYAGLLAVETPQEEDVLFSVAEKASIEAAKATGQEAEGAGMLFSISAVDADGLQEFRKNDIPGAKVFAKDADDHYYVFYRPTDFRMIRADEEEGKAAMEQWTALSEWASSVPDSFIAENAGLTAQMHTSGGPEADLARITSSGGARYTISSNELGLMEPGNVDPADYVEELTDDVTYEETDLSETPEGEYIVLDFPDDGVRYEFFLLEGKGNYVRQVWPDVERLYKAEFEDDSLTAAGIMQNWYYSLAETELGP